MCVETWLIQWFTTLAVHSPGNRFTWEAIKIYRLFGPTLTQWTGISGEDGHLLILMHKRQGTMTLYSFLVLVYSQRYFPLLDLRWFFRYMSEVSDPELVDSYRFFMWSWSGGPKADTSLWVLIKVKNARNSPCNRSYQSHVRCKVF